MRSLLQILPSMKCYQFETQCYFILDFVCLFGFFFFFFFFKPSIKYWPDTSNYNLHADLHVRFPIQILITVKDVVYVYWLFDLFMTYLEIIFMADCYISDAATQWTLQFQRDACDVMIPPCLENRCVKFYHPTRKEGALQKICKQDVCRCAEGNVFNFVSCKKV